MTTVHYRHVMVDDIQVFYRGAGEHHARTLVLLHGFPSSSHMFRNLLPILAEHFHVVAPDYPGYGYSESPNVKHFAYTFDHLEEVVEKVLDALLWLASGGECQNILLVAWQHWSLPFFATFAVEHVNHQSALGVRVDIADGQPGQFGAAQATGALKLDQGLPVGGLEVAITTRSQNDSLVESVCVMQRRKAPTRRIRDLTSLRSFSLCSVN